MTDNEALEIAKKQLSQAIHLSECGVNDGIRAIYEDKAEWLCSLIGCINRQKAEIERNREVIEYHEIVISALEKSLESEKTEAIREFAEKLKRKSELLAPSVYAEPYRAVSVDGIDNLVKEMTEGDNG